MSRAYSGHIDLLPSSDFWPDEEWAVTLQVWKQIKGNGGDRWEWQVRIMIVKVLWWWHIVCYLLLTPVSSADRHLCALPCSDSQAVYYLIHWFTMLRCRSRNCIGICHQAHTCTLWVISWWWLSVTDYTSISKIYGCIIYTLRIHVVLYQQSFKYKPFSI